MNKKKDIPQIFHKLVKVFIITFGVISLISISILIIFFILLSMVDVDHDNRPFEEKYPQELVMNNYIDYKEPIYSCLFFCMIYSEFYYENSIEQFENNENYHELTNEEYSLLEDFFKIFSNFSQYEDALSFDYKNQLKKGDFVNIHYNKNKSDRIYEYRIYYFDKEKEILYYFYYFD